MKKLIAIVIISLMVTSPVYAATVTKTIGTTIQVSSNFDLSLGASAVDFGLVLPGGISSSKSVAVTCVNNVSQDWVVNMKATPMTDGASFTIPAQSGPAGGETDHLVCGLMLDADALGTSEYQYDSDQGGFVGTKKAWPDAAGDTIYTSGALETGQLTHVLLLYVNVPGNQPANTYTNTITIEMVSL